MESVPSPGFPAGTRAESETLLRERFPEWEIWLVPLAVGGFRWCARRHDNHREIRNADSPALLASELENYGRE